MRLVTGVVLLAVLLGACATDPAAPAEAEDRTCVDQHSAGLSPSPNVQARTLPASTLYPSDSQHPGATFSDGEWRFVAQYYMYYPLPVEAGEHVVGFAWQVSKRTGPNEIAASIQKLGTRNETVDGSVSDEHYTECGALTIGTSQIDHLVAEGERYILRVAENGADGTDTFRDAVVFVAR